MSSFLQKSRLVLGGAILGTASCIGYKYMTIKLDKRPLSQSMVRFARPTDNLDEIVSMYKNGLNMDKFFEFRDHDGFDGVILGFRNNLSYHIEFVHEKGETVGKAPTKDNLFVFYVKDKDEFEQTCQRMIKYGFKSVKSYNPYWDDNNAKTFEDIDGYRVVLSNEDFSAFLQAIL